jgi:hypothetical protein
VSISSNCEAPGDLADRLVVEALGGKNHVLFFDAEK